MYTVYTHVSQPGHPLRDSKNPCFKVWAVKDPRFHDTDREDVSDFLSCLVSSDHI